jgi:hypothetical protein
LNHPSSSVAAPGVTGVTINSMGGTET